MAKKKNKIECIRDHYHLRIYINGFLHLQLDMENHDGMQSWYKGEHRFFIEFYRKKGEPIMVGYQDEGDWKTILKFLDEKI